MYIFLECQDCCETVEVYCDGDNAMICPECLSVDNFDEVQDENN